MQQLNIIHSIIKCPQEIFQSQHPSFSQGVCNTICRPRNLPEIAGFEFSFIELHLH